MSPLKHCPRCGCDFPRTTEFFYPVRAGSKALRSLCRPCYTREYAAKWMARYRSDPEFRQRHLQVMKNQNARKRALAEAAA